MNAADSRPLFTLSVTAEILGVHPRTLMIYEEENLVVPFRTKTNRRRYSQANIKKLQFIRFLTNKKGINLAGVHSILSLIKEAENQGISLQEKIFPNFLERKVI